jgi:hypothetical protein
MNVVQFPVFRRIDPADMRALQRPAPSDPAGVNVVSLWGGCPWNEELSDYDRQNIHLYARLLHDESEGAGEDDLARDVLGLNPYRNRSHTLRILRSHLERARWIRNTLFPMLGW